MTENPTETNENETNEKPCPLTRGEWLALLAAESQVMHGCMNMAVTVATMFVAMVLAVAIYVASILVAVVIYAASHHEGFISFFNSFSTLIYVVIAVVYVMIVVAATFFMLIVIIRASKEEYENSETIRKIIAGELTGLNEIRKQYDERKSQRKQCNLRNLF